MPDSEEEKLKLIHELNELIEKKIELLEKLRNKIN